MMYFHLASKMIVCVHSLRHLQALPGSRSEGRFLFIFSDPFARWATLCTEVTVEQQQQQQQQQHHQQQQQHISHPELYPLHTVSYVRDNQLR